MVATDDDRSFDLALGNELVEEQSGLLTLAVPEPADTSRQAFVFDALCGGVEPVVQVLVLGEELLQRCVGDGDVFGITRERGPAERAEALAEERANVGRHEAGKLEGAVVAALARFVADRVAVVEHLGARILKLDHCLHVCGHGCLRIAREALGVGLGAGQAILDLVTDRQI